MVSPLPNVAFRHRSEAYLKAAIAAAREADAVFVDFIGLFQFVAPLRRALESMGDRRSSSSTIISSTAYAVRWCWPRNPQPCALCWPMTPGRPAANRIADALLPNTPADEALFKTVTTKPMQVIMPAYAGPRAPARVIDQTTPRRILILGNHDAHHKRMVLERTLAALSAKGIERLCTVDVVGGGETASFEARYPGFNFYGYVENLESYLQTVRFGLIPDEIGGGFKIRALTHAFQRVPMLAVRSALNGMGFTAGRDFEVAENLDQLAGQIPALLEDFPRLNQLQDAAYRHCETAFDWGERGRTLHAFVSQLPRSDA